MVEDYKKGGVEQEREIQGLMKKIALDSARLSASRATRSSLEAVCSKVLSDLSQNVQAARLLCDEKDLELEELSARFTRFLQVCVSKVIYSSSSCWTTTMPLRVISRTDSVIYEYVSLINVAFFTGLNKVYNRFTSTLDRESL